MVSGGRNVSGDGLGCTFFTDGGSGVILGGFDKGEGLVKRLLASDEARGGMLTSFASCRTIGVPWSTVGLAVAIPPASRLD